MTPPGAAAASDADVVAPGVAGYAGSGNQSDAAVQVLPDGARLLSVMYGPLAPTHIDFPLTLNAGETLQESGTGYKVVDGAGDTDAVIDPPWAVDAAHKPVPAYYELVGSTLTLVLDTSSVTYPVVADPTVRSSGNTSDSGASNPLSGGGGGGGGQGGSCPGAAHQVRNVRCQNGSVDSLTGEFVQSVTDVTRPSRGPSFGMTRTYRSGRTTAGALGAGWTYSYAASLSVNGTNGNVTLDGEDALPLVFTKSGSTYTGPPSGRSKLATNPNIGGFDLTRRDEVVYHFTAAGVLQTVTDRNGNTLTIDHNGAGQVVDVRDQQTHTVNFAYTSGLLTQVTTGDSRIVRYGYTGGLLTSVTDPAGDVTTYAYTSGGLLRTITDGDTNTVVTNAYTNGDVVKQTDALGHDTTFNQAVVINGGVSYVQSTMTDANGGTWVDTYDPSGNLASRTDAAGNTTSYTYTARGNPLRTTDPAGGATDYTQDANDNQTGTTIDSGKSTQSSTSGTFNSNNDPITSVDAAGNTTSYAYGADGKNLTKQTNPDGTTKLFGRDTGGSGLLMSTTDENGHQTAMTYGGTTANPNGEIASTTQPLGDKTTQHHDNAGRVDSSIEPRGYAAGATATDYQTSSTFDNDGRVKTRTTPGATAGGTAITSSTSYENNGNKHTTTDGNGNVTTYTYDAMNHLTSVTAPDGAVTAYAYDSVGNLVTRTAQNVVNGVSRPETTTYNYNKDRQLTSVTDPIGNQFTYGYDTRGNRNRTTDANGNATTAAGDGVTLTTYDSHNRVATVDYADSGPGTDITYAYRPDSKRATMTDPNGKTIYGYDTKTERLNSVTRDGGATTYTYNKTGKVSGRTYPDGSGTVYTYDDDDRMATVIANSATTTYGYNVGGLLKTTVTPSGSSGITETRAYEPSGRLKSVTNVQNGLALTKAAYTYDRDGNPVTVITQSDSVTYRYSSRNMLMLACYGSSGTCDTTGATTDDYLKYTYDLVGNRISKERPVNGTNTLTNYVYNADDELTSRTWPTGSCTNAYDANGNTTNDCGTTYTYNDADQTTSASTSSTSGGLTLTVTQTYTYDGDNNRLTVGNAGSVIERYLWDTNNQLPQLERESNADGTLLRRYTRGMQTLSMTTPDDTYYYQHDGQGSVISITASNGIQQTAYAYAPYGDLRSNQNLTTNAPTNDLRYTGAYHDDFTDTYDLRARQYDPSTGRFTQTDPVPNSIRDPYVSSYAYVGNQPTRKSDPSGDFAVTANLTGCLGEIVAECATVSFDFIALTTSFSLDTVVGGSTGISVSLGVSVDEAPVYNTFTLCVPPVEVSIEISLVDDSFLGADVGACEDPDFSVTTTV